MTDAELDALLAAPLPDLDTTAFSVGLMEAIAREEARPARILAWITAGLLGVVMVVAAMFGAAATSHGVTVPLPLAFPIALAGLALVLSYSVFQTARE
jgi:crotonobetainyl-CoA:carnitine CoA-transferase CaiB-like acyl-CoA transferase